MIFSEHIMQWIPVGWSNIPIHASLISSYSVEKEDKWFLLDQINMVYDFIWQVNAYRMKAVEAWILAQIWSKEKFFSGYHLLFTNLLVTLIYGHGLVRLMLFFNQGVCSVYWSVFVHAIYQYIYIVQSSY